MFILFNMLSKNWWNITIFKVLNQINLFTLFDSWFSRINNFLILILEKIEIFWFKVWDNFYKTKFDWLQKCDRKIEMFEDFFSSLKMLKE